MVQNSAASLRLITNTKKRDHIQPALDELKCLKVKERDEHKALTLAFKTMRNQAVKVRIYPTEQQVQILAQHFGCARWWWNYGLNKCIETYKDTGKGLSRGALNSMLPKLKKEKETEWLKECYSQILQAVMT